MATEHGEQPLDLTACPECGSPAEIEWRAVCESTDGPVEHAKVRCVAHHVFLLPTARLRAVRTATAPFAAGAR